MPAGRSWPNRRSARGAGTIDSGPDSFTLRRFSQGRGTIKKGGSPLAGVTSGTFTYTNTLERIRLISGTNVVDALDPALAAVTGSLSVRFDGATLVAEATDGDAVSLEYGYTTADGFSLKFEFPRVFLPKPKFTLSGPGGVEVGFDWRAAYDATVTAMLRVTLFNDVSSYA